MLSNDLENKFIFANAYFFSIANYFLFFLFDFLNLQMEIVSH